MKRDLSDNEIEASTSESGGQHMDSGEDDGGESTAILALGPSRQQMDFFMSKIEQVMSKYDICNTLLTMILAKLDSVVFMAVFNAIHHPTHVVPPVYREIAVNSVAYGEDGFFVTSEFHKHIGQIVVEIALSSVTRCVYNLRVFHRIESAFQWTVVVAWSTPETFVVTDELCSLVASGTYKHDPTLDTRYIADLDTMGKMRCLVHGFIAKSPQLEMCGNTPVFPSEFECYNCKQTVYV